jgi:hypothetical protein
MTESQIKHIQDRIGAQPDGFWGPKSITACQKYLTDMMPKPHPFPAEGTNAFDAFYGRHGVKDGYTPPGKRIKLPFTIFYEGTAVTTLTAHEKCADSLLAVFERLAKAFPEPASRYQAGITTYDGLYNPRLKRGSSTSWSMHSWMNAIDLNAGENGNTTAWPVASTMPIEVMECFAQEGWLSAGAFWGRDAMHFQATRPV